MQITSLRNGSLRAATLTTCPSTTFALTGQKPSQLEHTTFFSMAPAVMFPSLPLA